jgi:hypothetical protein
VERDPALERELLDTAARSLGLPSDHGLGALASARAYPDPVRLPRDFDQEIREELADAANYARWAIQETHARLLAGDPDVADGYERRMRVLAALVHAWRELHRGAA